LSTVIDCSVAINWVMPDERNEGVDRLLDRVIEQGGAVPPLFRVEVGNALLTGLLRNRITPDFLGRAVGRLGELPLHADARGADFVWTTCVDLATTYDLTLYDAVYLELALRLRLPLATLDKKLAGAAENAGVALDWTEL